ncbi:MAG: MBL fold metallo-hydrolase [Candidatus Aenigmatarchaeota archaeon]
MKNVANRMVFLGTGGGKNVMFTQVRKTGGIFVELDGTRFIIDPGPGSLVNAQKLGLTLQKLDGILLSHLHPDHSTDANALLDGIRDPILIAEEHCLKPKDRYYPCVSKYHQEKSKVKAMKKGKKTKIKNLIVEAVNADHYVPTIGFKIKGSKTIGYASDGTYFKGQEKYFENCDLLILNVLVPKEEKAEPHWHMSVENAIEMLNKIKKKPRLVVIQHFSFWMLRANVANQAKIMEEETGVKCIPAEDFMELNLNTLSTKKR